MSSEYVLAVDSSTSVGWVTLARIDDGTRLVIISELAIKAHSHAEALLSAVHTVLESQGLSPAALGLLVFGDGPGSFTGLRIGASLISGLAFGISGRVLGVSSHVGIACAYFNSVLLSSPSTFSASPAVVRIFSDGGDKLVSSTFRIFNESSTGFSCELLNLMSVVDPESVDRSSDTIMIGTEGLCKGRGPIPGIEEITRLDTLPISSGLLSALYSVSNRGGVPDAVGLLHPSGFVSDFTNSCEIRYGQPVKAMTLSQRRGW
jgi:tRNA threonylcarbamoyl adenosine modification protein YeaZ